MRLKNHNNRAIVESILKICPVLTKMEKSEMDEENGLARSNRSLDFALPAEWLF